MPRLREDPSTLPVLLTGEVPSTEIKTGNWRNVRPVVHKDDCTGCMICWKFCPEACVEIEVGKPRISLDYCKGCGVCAEECPAECIEMKDEQGAS